MKIRYIMTSVAALLVIFFGLFYILFDHYVSSASNEAVMGWIKGEENSIIEGSLLSSMTKTQKILLSSEFIKGLAVVDQTDINLRPLIEFGQRIDLKKVPLRQTRIYNTGFLKKYLLMDAPNSPNLKIIFLIYSEKINNLFWITSSIFCFLTLLFGLAIYLLKKSEQKIIESYAQKAKQAAHDLAQPIVVLNSVAHLLQDSNTDVIKSVISRINNIVNELSDKKIVQTGKSLQEVSTSLSEKIGNLVQEKQLTSGNRVSISLDVKARLEEVAFDQYLLIRVLSNILQNSLEASARNIIFNVIEIDNKIEFLVKDDGLGIPDSFKDRLGEKGFTHGKTFGSGLGLFGAFEFAKANNGDIRISSNLSQGTEIILSLPKYIEQKIVLAADTKLFVLDDEELVLSAWKLKLKNLELDQPIEYFRNVQTLSARMKNFDPNEIFVLSDYNLNDSVNGLDFIEAQSLQGQSALITGQADDQKIIERSKRLKVSLISKSDLHNLKIQLV